MAAGVEAVLLTEDDRRSLPSSSAGGRAGEEGREEEDDFGLEDLVGGGNGRGLNFLERKRSREAREFMVVGGERGGGGIG